MASIKELLQKSQEILDKTAAKSQSSLDFLKLLSKAKESAKSASLDDLLSEVKELKAMVLSILIETQLSKVSNILSEISPKTPDKPTISPKDACDSLADIATSKTINDERVFLLHRMTPDFEYENSINGNLYKTDKPTEWVVNFDYADKVQDLEGAKDKSMGVNPMMSCWIPESHIISIPGISENTGTWGDLGVDRKSNRYIVNVKPGEFTVYSELKQ